LLLLIRLRLVLWMRRLLLLPHLLLLLLPTLSMSCDFPVVFCRRRKRNGSVSISAFTWLTIVL
jgi:hypothetical protein